MKRSQSYPAEGGLQCRRAAGRPREYCAAGGSRGHCDARWSRELCVAGQFQGHCPAAGFQDCTAAVLQDNPGAAMPQDGPGAVVTQHGSKAVFQRTALRLSCSRIVSMTFMIPPARLPEACVVSPSQGVGSATALRPLCCRHPARHAPLQPCFATKQARCAAGSDVSNSTSTLAVQG